MTDDTTMKHIAEDCPCTQKPCPIRGDCVKCVSFHRKHKKHLPECMEDIIRDTVRDLAAKVEFKVADARPTPEFWDEHSEDVKKWLGL